MRSSGKDETFCMSSQVKEILEKAADGSRPENLDASLACFNRLTPRAFPSSADW